MTDRQGLAVAALLTVMLWGLHFIWLSKDSLPPVWDMATHQTYALNYLQPDHPESAAKPWEKSGNYPPFVHLVLAAVFAVLHPGPHIARLINMPATFLLFWSVYQLGKDLAGAAAGRWACILTALTPYLIWISRETILDYWLSAWFAAALVALRSTKNFESHRWSLLLGAIAGLGLLTKWFFAALIAVPLIYVCARSRIWKSPERCVRLFDTIIVAGLVAAPWYLPNIPRLVRYFSENAQYGVREGEPPVLSVQSFIYYLRLLEGYQFFALLFVLLLAACFFSIRKRLIKDWGFLAAAIGGGWILMTLLRTKDPRFTMPLLGPMLVIAGAWLQSWRPAAVNAVMKGALVALLCIQAYAANFGIRWLPQKVVILPGYQGSLRWDWNLYLQNYHGIFGKPRWENWQQEEILRRIVQDAKDSGLKPALAVIPDMPWFSEGNFKLFARYRGLQIPVQHLQSAAGGIDSFRGFNYILMTEKEQGMSWTTENSAALNQIVVDHPLVFHLVEIYMLPNGDAARLYRLTRGDVSAPAVAGSAALNMTGIEVQ